MSLCRCYRCLVESFPAILDLDVRALDRAAFEASEVLNVPANPWRLRLLCALLHGESCTGERKEALGASQSCVSGQPARLRAEGLFDCDRDGGQVGHRRADRRLAPILLTLFDVV
jgi:hypothetical protein